MACGGAPCESTRESGWPALRAGARGESGTCGARVKRAQSRRGGGRVVVCGEGVRPGTSGGHEWRLARDEWRRARGWILGAASGREGSSTATRRARPPLARSSQPPCLTPPTATAGRSSCSTFSASWTGGGAATGWLRAGSLTTRRARPSCCCSTWPPTGPHWLPLGLLAALCSTVNVHGVPRGFVRICSRGGGASGDGAVPLVPKQDSASHC